MRPLSFFDFVKLLSGKEIEGKNPLITGVAIDSRSVVPGAIFCALPGARTDGHAFLQEAAGKGAVAALVKEDYRGETFNLSLLRVPDVLEALQKWARLSLAKRRCRVIGVTGSLGKTTTKEFIKTLLSTTYTVGASPGNHNTRVTLPLSILNAEGDEDFLVLEMGMTNPGQIEKLVEIAPPHIAVITTVAVQHASHFPDGLAGIAREKGSIFKSSATEVGFVHREVHHFEEIVHIGSCAKKSFSFLDEEADIFGKRVEGGIIIKFKSGENFIAPFPLSLPGHDLNFLAAVSVATHCGVPWHCIEDSASSLKLPPMRFERVEKGSIVFINDAYNANPDSMKMALENLPSPAGGGKKIAVLSEMDSLGMYADAGHSLVAEAALDHVDLLLCVGEKCDVMARIWRREKKPIHMFNTKEELRVALRKHINKGDVVLLKGARKYALDELLEEF